MHRDLEKGEEKIHDFLQRERRSPPSYRQRYGLLHNQCLVYLVSICNFDVRGIRPKLTNRWQVFRHKPLLTVPVGRDKE